MCIEDALVWSIRWSPGELALAAEVIVILIKILCSADFKSISKTLIYCPRIIKISIFYQL